MRSQTPRPSASGAMARYLYGEMDSESMRQFEEALPPGPGGSPPGLASLRAQGAFVDRHLNAPIDVDGAWERLHHRLQADHLIPRPRAWRAWVRVAASVALLIALGSAVLVGLFWGRGSTVRLSTAGATETLALGLPDGSLVYLSPNSEFTHPRVFRGPTRSVSLRGQAFFDVAPRAGAPFTIETPSSLVEVLGTSFSLSSSDGHALELLVRSGQVRVLAKAHPAAAVIAQAGERVSLQDNLLVKSAIGADHPQGPHLGRLHFRDASLGTVVDVLNRHYPVTFRLDHPQLEQRVITLTLQGESPEAITWIICKTLSLRAHVGQDTITFFQ